MFVSMDIESFRDYCLSFEGVTEKTPFGKFARRYESILVFYVLDHMFCFFDMDDFTSITVKSEPEVIEELRQTHYSVSRPLNQSLRHWIQLDFNGDISDELIRRMVSEAYRLVCNKYTCSPRAKRK